MVGRLVHATPRRVGPTPQRPGRCPPSPPSFPFPMATFWSAGRSNSSPLHGAPKSLGLAPFVSFRNEESASSWRCRTVGTRQILHDGTPNADGRRSRTSRCQRAVRCAYRGAHAVGGGAPRGTRAGGPRSGVPSSATAPLGPQARGRGSRTKFVRAPPRRKAPPQGAGFGWGAEAPGTARRGGPVAIVRHRRTAARSVAEGKGTGPARSAVPPGSRCASNGGLAPRNGGGRWGRPGPKP